VELRAKRAIRRTAVARQRQAVLDETKKLGSGGRRGEEEKEERSWGEMDVEEEASGTAVGARGGFGSVLGPHRLMADLGLLWGRCRLLRRRRGRPAIVTYLQGFD